MAELQSPHTEGFEVRQVQPLIGIPVQKDGEEVVQYFTDEDEVEAATPSELNRIRHESKPTPPIDL